MRIVVAMREVHERDHVCQLTRTTDLCAVVVPVSDCTSAARLAGLPRPDLIVVGPEWLEGEGERVLRAVRDEWVAPVVVIATRVAPALGPVAIRAGVTAILSLPQAAADFELQLRLVHARWQEARQTARALAKELEHRREQALVRRAKALLMAGEPGLTEDAAHKRLRSMAMNRRVRIGQIAAAYLLGSGDPVGPPACEGGRAPAPRDMEGRVGA